MSSLGGSSAFVSHCLFVACSEVVLNYESICVYNAQQSHAMVLPLLFICKDQTHLADEGVKLRNYTGVIFEGLLNLRTYLCG